MAGTEPRRVASLFESIAVLEAQPGPTTPRFAVPLDRPLLYQWIPFDDSDIDHVTVLSATGGIPGAWIQVRYNDRGEDLEDESVDIGVDGGSFRVLPDGTLSEARVVTLSTDGAQVGDSIEILRLDSGESGFSVANGGPGEGTLADLSNRGFLKAWFDGTDWLPRASGFLV